MSDSERAERIRNQRIREMERKYIPPLPSSFEATVVGVTFVPGYPQNLYDLEGLHMEADMVGERLAVRLVRNPQNEHDPNAIQVHVDGVGMVGHMTAPLAQRLAPEMDAGIEWDGELVMIAVSQENPSRPGIKINCNRSTQ